MTTFDADTIRAAVRTLYGISSPAAQEANAFLIEFQQSETAWQIAHGLLQYNEPKEIQFFAASLLVRKFREREWHRTDQSFLLTLQAAFTATFQEALTWPSISPLVLRQLCLLQAAALVSVSPTPDHLNAVGDLVTKTLALLHVNPTAALELLIAIAEEANDLQPRHRTVLATCLLSSAPQLYSLLDSLLTHTLQQTQHAAASQTLRCLLSWFQLSPHPSGGQLGPSEFHSKYPDLFLCVLQAVVDSSSSGEVTTAAAAVFLFILGSNTFGGPGEDDDNEGAALSAVICSLLSIQHRLLSVDEETAVAVAQVGAAVAERWPEGACGLLENAEHLSVLMLHCLDRPESMVTEVSLDYFYMINTVPLSQRLPQLGAPLFQHMVVRLLPHVTHHHNHNHHHHHHHHEETHIDDGQGGDDDDDDDDDGFYRLREDVLPEALQEAYGLLRGAYVQWAWEGLQSATTWQSAEAALYYVGAVALSARSRVLAGPESLRDAAVAADAVATRTTLHSIFQNVCCRGEGDDNNNTHHHHGGGREAISSNSNSMLLCKHRPLARTVCWVIEQYAVWFGKAEGAPVSAALQTTLWLIDTTSGSAATKAFHALCLRCSLRLQDLTTIMALQEQGHAVLQRSQLAVGDERLVVEGMAQLASGLPSDQAEMASTCLTRPFVVALRAALADDFTATATTSTAQLSNRRAVIRALELLAAALKSFLSAALAAGTSQNRGGPAVSVMHSMDDALTMVACSPLWHSDTDVMSALIEVYKQAVCSARRRSLELLSTVMPAVGAVFAATALPSCLDVLAEAVEIHFQDAGVIAQLLEGMRVACDTAFPLLQGDGLRERGPLAAALLGLTDSFAVYSPTSLWPSPLLPHLLGLATALLAQAREVEPVARALSVFGHVLATTLENQGDDVVGLSHIHAVYAVILSQGQSMVVSLLRALVDTCPRQLMRTAADRLRLLMHHPALLPHHHHHHHYAVDGENGHANGNGNQMMGMGMVWVQAAVMSGQLPGVAEGVLTRETCEKFCSLACGDSLRAARLTALLVDFGLVARREESADVLLGYEL